MTPFRLGLTGSIGMGKSTTAAMFADEGIPVWDADAAVHRLYAKGGAAVGPLSALCAAANVGGAIDRNALKIWIAGDPSALVQIESVVHPLVAADRAEFLAAARSDIVVLDIPLLFEKGSEVEMDATLLVTAPPDLQRARVMARPGMTETQFAAILARQMPDRDKRARADHIIETLAYDSVRAGVRALIGFIRERL
ncbi:dephospho-CoA kinase [Rhodobacteraceae bacterium HSP-20]|uniref:Dephospho-CoA kinase n=1 Tax=Paragemmobacter amnigenus TaxID=2852097 RepID=A0ABS6J279_9RHOB|nr:dephospho-CoA kinase [Rhodobacter amnigenus]MBU9697871.1 dephospho-CoA kinase [Rhodobacter amnigenus]MBV4389098.1 dephospho-CoA kinase [Rhodobacter amnigenus]